MFNLLSKVKIIYTESIYMENYPENLKAVYTFLQFIESNKILISIIILSAKVYVLQSAVKISI